MHCISKLYTQGLPPCAILRPMCIRDGAEDLPASLYDVQDLEHIVP